MTFNKLMSCLAAAALAVFISGCSKAPDDSGGGAVQNEPAPAGELGEPGDASEMTNDNAEENEEKAEEPGEKKEDEKGAESGSEPESGSAQ